MTGARVVVALVLLGVALGVVRFFVEDFNGSNELVVWAPESADVQVSLDGAKPVTVKAGGFWVLDEVKPGKHEVVSTAGGERFAVTADVPHGRGRFAVPSSAAQCFAVADVSGLYVSAERPKPRPASLEVRLTSHQVEKLPKGTFLGETPSQTFRSTELYLVKPFECEAMKNVNDAGLLALMGLD